MKHRKGYLLVESIITLSLIVVLASILYYMLFFSINLKSTIEDKIELQQQSIEITKQIEKVIGESKGIINITSTNSIPVTSIKCKYMDRDIKNSSIKDKELSLKTDKSKLFINTLNIYGNSETGGYEIGDYIDSMYISLDEGGRLANIKLKLSKNMQKYETNFSVYIRNFEGDNI
ncbi:hypothetical protein [Romboutsia sp.]|uniref:hypothetical protein n=1 Tax=Romboutsia sp. TaxID=1965302 RepID=UPI003F3D364E